MKNYDKIFNINIEAKQPQLGSLLVSEPFLKDEYFGHSVICLIDFERDSNPMGVVMNHRTAYTLDQLIEGIESEQEIAVWCGGPVATDRLYFMHTLGDMIPDSREIVPGLYVGGDFEWMKNYVNSGLPIDRFIRFFIGYSGWSHEQLAQEITDNVWAVTDIKSPSALLEGGEDSYWHLLVRQLGSDYRNWLYHPRNPHLN